MGVEGLVSLVDTEGLVGVVGPVDMVGIEGVEDQVDMGDIMVATEGIIAGMVGIVGSYPD